MKRSSVLIATAALAAGLLPGAAMAQSGWIYLECRTAIHAGLRSDAVRPDQPARYETNVKRISLSPLRWQGLTAATPPGWRTDACSFYENVHCEVDGDEVRLIGSHSYTVNLRTLRQTYDLVSDVAPLWGDGVCRRIADPTNGG